MIRWNELMRAMVLVRLGQELGTDSRLARLVHDWITLILTLGGILGLQWFRFGYNHRPIGSDFGMVPQNFAAPLDACSVGRRLPHPRGLNACIGNERNRRWMHTQTNTSQ